MGLSEIRALKTFKQSFVLFTGAIGNPATGKSPARGIIKEALIRGIIKVN
jgi:hypothetical protein